jgi:hypothetical protein
LGLIKFTSSFFLHVVRYSLEAHQVFQVVQESALADEVELHDLFLAFQDAPALVDVVASLAFEDLKNYQFLVILIFC